MPHAGMCVARITRAHTYAHMCSCYAICWTIFGQAALHTQHRHVLWRILRVRLCASLKCRTLWRVRPQTSNQGTSTFDGYVCVVWCPCVHRGRFHVLSAIMICPLIIKRALHANTNSPHTPRAGANFVHVCQRAQLHNFRSNTGAGASVAAAIRTRA